MLCIEVRSDGRTSRARCPERGLSKGQGEGSAGAASQEPQKSPDEPGLLVFC